MFKKLRFQQRWKWQKGYGYIIAATPRQQKKQGRIPTDSKLRDVQGYKLQIKMIITTEIGTDFEMEIKFAIIFADTAQMLDMIVVTSLQANPNDGKTLLNSYHKP